MNLNGIIKRIFLTIPVAAAMLTALTGCDGNKWRSAEGAVWATSYHITYHGPKELHDSIIAVMKDVEMSLSPFNEASAISRLNRGETDSVDAMFIRVFTVSQQVCRASGGLYDPTVAPLVNLWGFGYKKTCIEPDSSAVDSCRSLVDIASCRIEGSRLVRGKEGMEFDFSSITKGMGCDMVGEMLVRNGVTDYMVEIGGEMALRGRNPHGEDWHVMIDAPKDAPSVPSGRIALIGITDCGVATSGNYRNYKLTPSGRVWHSISPVTGRPAITTVLSATVIAPTAMEADALATACMVMEPKAALAMVESMEGAEALLIADNGKGGYRFVSTEGFPEIMK